MGQDNNREIRTIPHSGSLSFIVFGEPQDPNLRTLLHCSDQSFILDSLSEGLQKHHYPEAKPALLRSAC